MDVAAIYTKRLLSMPLTNGEFFIAYFYASLKT